MLVLVSGTVPPQKGNIMNMNAYTTLVHPFVGLEMEHKDGWGVVTEVREYAGRTSVALRLRRTGALRVVVIQH